MSNAERDSGQTNRTSVVELTDEPSFTSFIEGEDTVLVDFFADWCGPCHQLSPRLAEVGASFPSRVGKVDVEALPSLASRFGVRSLPTVIVYEGGEPIDRFVGVQPTSAFTDALE